MVTNVQGQAGKLHRSRKLKALTSIRSNLERVPLSCSLRPISLCWCRSVAIGQMQPSSRRHAS